MRTTEIEKAKYEGYLWRSDQSAPEVYDGTQEFGLSLPDEDNPFIIEGNLWDAAQKRSIMIRYIDGRYHVRKVSVEEWKLQEISDGDVEAKEGQMATTVKEYLAHRIGDVGKLRFLQYWRAEKDKLCEGMLVLRPYQLVFVGFVKKEG